jgi:Zn-dependent protease with chaperone function
MMFAQTLRRLTAATVLLLLLLPAAAFAQGKKEKKELKKEEASYFFPYVATFVAVGIGLTAVCMPSHRKSEVEMDEEE